MTISEGVARSTVKLDYEISRATLTQLVLEVPTDQKVVNVFDRNVKRWDVEAADGKQVIRVDLFEATQGKQTLLVELEQFSDATETAYDVPAALVRAVGVGRQQGIVVARLEEGLQGEAIKRTGLLQLDQNDLPESLRAASWGFAYRYGAVPYELTLRVEKVLPANLGDRADRRGVGRRQADPDLARPLFRSKTPGCSNCASTSRPGLKSERSRARSIGDGQAAAVDSYHRVSDDAPTWLVNLSKKAFGKVGLTVQLERQLSDPNLLSPTGSASTIAVPLPRATAADVEFAQGSSSSVRRRACA